MATKIIMSNGRNPASERIVTEEPQEVAGRVNAGVTNEHAFVVFTDRDAGKEFSIDPRRVVKFESV